VKRPLLLKVQNIFFAHTFSHTVIYFIVSAIQDRNYIPAMEYKR
jgi:hypothetical protein